MLELISEIDCQDINDNFDSWRGFLPTCQGAES
jgi:hypothetical protein